MMKKRRVSTSCMHRPWCLFSGIKILSFILTAWLFAPCTHFGLAFCALVLKLKAIFLSFDIFQQQYWNASLKVKYILHAIKFWIADHRKLAFGVTNKIVWFWMLYLYLCAVVLWTFLLKKTKYNSNYMITLKMSFMLLTTIFVIKRILSPKEINNYDEWIVIIV